MKRAGETRQETASAQEQNSLILEKRPLSPGKRRILELLGLTSLF